MTSLLSSAAEYLPFIPRPAPRYVTEEGTRVYGMVAEFTDTPSVVHAAEMVRDAGYTRWDVSSPFPIHGMEEAMGQKKTRLPYLVFGAAMAGVTAAVGMQFFMNAIDYRFIVQGKDPYAWEAYLPIIFELGVLFSAFAALIGMLALNGLPRFNHPLFTSERFLATGDDRFIVAIEADDPAFDPEATKKLLEDAGGVNIDLIEDEG